MSEDRITGPTGILDTLQQTIFMELLYEAATIHKKNMIPNTVQVSTFAGPLKQVAALRDWGYATGRTLHTPTLRAIDAMSASPG